MDVSKYQGFKKNWEILIIGKTHFFGKNFPMSVIAHSCVLNGTLGTDISTFLADLQREVNLLICPPSTVI